MSATTSAATGRCFGIQRVCQVWERSRSALYARRARAHHRLGAGPARRGPAPRQSDAQLLAAIRTDLARSPFHGEGHRKVHARLRILDGIRVARTRVLRVMRAHGLLSPHRGRQGAAKTHDGRVITQAPNVMWGTDGVRVFTLDDGWGWIFAAVEHWNAECVGWARVQSRESLRGTRSDCARARTSLWFAGRRCRPRAGASDGPRQSVSVRPLPQADPVLGDPPQFRLCRGTGNERGGGAVELHAQGASDPRPNLSEPRGPSASPWPTSWSGTTRPGVSRSLGITRRSRRARSMCYARRPSTNVCPGNRVRYRSAGRATPSACAGSSRAPAGPPDTGRNPPPTHTRAPPP